MKRSILLILLFILGIILTGNSFSNENPSGTIMGFKIFVQDRNMAQAVANPKPFMELICSAEKISLKGVEGKKLLFYMRVADENEQWKEKPYASFEVEGKSEYSYTSLRISFADLAKAFGTGKHKIYVGFAIAIAGTNEVITGAWKTEEFTIEISNEYGSTTNDSQDSNNSNNNESQSEPNDNQ